MKGKENGESVVRYLNGISSPSPLPKKNLDYFEARQHLLYVGWEVKKDEIGVFYLSPEQDMRRSFREACVLEVCKCRTEDHQWKHCSLCGYHSDHLRSAFCTEECKLAFNDMEPLLFKVDRISEEFSWTSMKGNNTLPRFLQNPMLLTAAQLVRSAFDYDVIPDLLFGYGMYAGFYTHAMWKKSDLVCAITFQIHSRAKEVFGEVPYIVTAEEYRGRGCLKVMMEEFECFLKTFSVKRLLMSSLSTKVDLWTEGFEYVKISEEDLNKILEDGSVIVDFENTEMLTKEL
ncbi:uncharacterized protein LOC127079856 [Lathyrus oleraceus]|nr:uncharacterized protein LOC127079856 [Pisum sativum]